MDLLEDRDDFVGSAPLTGRLRPGSSPGCPVRSQGRTEDSLQLLRSLTTACFLRVSSRSLWMSGALMGSILPVKGVTSTLPARDNETGATPQGDGTDSAHQPAPHCRSGQQKRGVAPVHLRFPRAAPPSRETIRNPNGDSRLEKSRRARRRDLLVHMPPVVSCALPGRHGTPLSGGQDRTPGGRLERQITKPAGRTTTAAQRSRTDAGCRLPPAR